jgi:hypothetical protein
MSKVNIVLSGIGVIGTFLYLGAVFWLFGEKEFGALGPNEIGDFLAGVSSPLAFLWLVLGFFQQGLELRASREALILQARELGNSVEQQKELVEVSRRQLQAEIDARVVERHLNSKKVQPILVISSNGYSSNSSGKFQQNFRLGNAGHPITSVRLNWSVAVACELKNISLLDTNGSRDFSITGDRGFLVESAILRVAYKDGFEDVQETNFLLTPSGNLNGAPYKIEKVEGETVSA